MKRKKLEKKVDRLEALLRKGKKKLLKLNRKVKAASTAAAEKQDRKSAKRLKVHASSDEPAKALTGAVSKLQVRTNGSKEPRSPKVKQTRVLTPQGRAKLSAAMKARWAAKRASATTKQ